MNLEPDVPRWSPEVLAENDFPALAQRQAEREAQREADGAESRAEWAALNQQEQEAWLAEQDAALEAEAEMEQDRQAREAEAELGHDYEGPEAQPGTPEYEATLAEYLEWTDSPNVEHGAEAELELDL